MKKAGKEKNHEPFALLGILPPGSVTMQESLVF